MKQHGKLGTLILCAAVTLAGAGCAMQADDEEAGISDGTAVDENVGDAQDAIWGAARVGAVGYGARGVGAYRAGFAGGGRMYW